MLTEVDILAEIDMSIEPPCEYRHHEELASTGPAYYLIRSSCWACSDSITIMMCEDCHSIGSTCYVGCECGEIGLAKDFWKVVQVL